MTDFYTSFRNDAYGSYLWFRTMDMDRDEADPIAWISPDNADIPVEEGCNAALDVLDFRAESLRRVGVFAFDVAKEKAEHHLQVFRISYEASARLWETRLAYADAIARCLLATHNNELGRCVVRLDEWMATVHKLDPGYEFPEQFGVDIRDCLSEIYEGYTCRNIYGDEPS